MSAPPDLRSFLAGREAAGDPVRVMAAGVSPELELAAIVKRWERPSPPLMLFPDVGGSGLPVAVGICATRERLAAALGVAPDATAATFRRRAAEPLEVEPVDDAPVQAAVETADASLARFPLSTHVPGQGGPFLTAALGVVRHRPAGPHNLGIYRMMVRGDRELTVSTPPTSDLGVAIAAAAEAGRRLDFAAILGHHPALHLASQARTGRTVDSFEVAGSLLGRPLRVVAAKTVDLLVPAEAEIVIEGVIDTARTVTEGPFAEFSGYLAAGTGHPVEVLAISSRARPIVQDIHPVHREHLCLFGHPARELVVSAALEAAGVEALEVLIPDDTAGMWAYLRLADGTDGGAAARAAVAADPILKVAVAVAAEVDVARHEEVLAAVATRASAAEWSQVAEMRATRFDPSARGRARMTKLAIDATGAGLPRPVTVPVAAEPGEQPAADWRAVVG